MNNETLLSGKSGDFIQDLGDAVRKNPVSAALIGMGVLWLFAGGNPLRQARHLAHRSGIDQLPDMASEAFAAGQSAVKSSFQSASDSVTNLSSHLADSVQGTAQSLGETLSSASASARDRTASALHRRTDLGEGASDSAMGFARSLPASGGDMIEKMRGNLANVFHEQPLVLGAIGIAIGAGIAASLASTKLESEYFGETSDQFKDKAQKFAFDQANQVKTVAEGVATAAAEEARHQGLTSEGLKSAAADIGTKVKTVVGAAGDSIKYR